MTHFTLYTSHVPYAPMYTVLLVDVTIPLVHCGHEEIPSKNPTWDNIF